MSKKVAIKKTNISSSVAMELNRLFDGGNFSLLRKRAHSIYEASETADKDRALAHHMLMVTWPDSLALLAGGACLLFSVIVAFFAAY